MRRTRSITKIIVLLVAVFVCLCVCCQCGPGSAWLEQSAGLPQISSATFPVRTSSPRILTQTATAGSTISPEETITLPPTASPSESPHPPQLLLRVEFIDVGQGLSVLVVGPGHQAALFDAGSAQAANAVIDRLRALQISHLDMLFVSHPHEDHIGGIPAVLRYVSVSKIISTGQPHTTASYEKFLDAAIDSDADWVEASKGASFVMGDALFSALSPSRPQPTGDLNHNSLVLQLSFGTTKFLLMGDADSDTERQILFSHTGLSSNVLQAGHHCSRSASSLAFIAAVRPAYAVCSLGSGNPYGHPHPATLQRFAQAGVFVLQTDIEGTIVFISDGDAVSWIR